MSLVLVFLLVAFAILVPLGLRAAHTSGERRGHETGYALGYAKGKAAVPARPKPNRHSVYNDFLTLSEADQDALWGQIGRMKRENDPNRREK